MLQTHQLTFRYADSATTFSFPDISTSANNTTLILGKSGTGKTTLLHLLGLLLTPSSGNIILNNKELSNLSGKELTDIRAKNFGIIWQKMHFVASLNVQENLLLSNYLANKKQATEQLKNLANQLGISDLLNKKTYQLSGGEQQRVSIARALMNQPSVILADEPTSNLDDENCERVANLLSEQAQHIGASLIIVTHDQRLKDRFSNQILLY